MNPIQSIHLEQELYVSVKRKSLIQPPKLSNTDVNTTGLYSRPCLLMNTAANSQALHVNTLIIDGAWKDRE